jgi:E3 ubiquitin-protein ligase DOA10
MNNYKVNVNGRTFIILNCENMLEAFDKINKEFNANKANIQVELFEEDVISFNDDETSNSAEEPQNMYAPEPAITLVDNIDTVLGVSENDDDESALKKTFLQQNLIPMTHVSSPMVVPMSSSDILMNQSNNREDQFISSILLENL